MIRGSQGAFAVPLRAVVFGIVLVRPRRGAWLLAGDSLMLNALGHAGGRSQKQGAPKPQ